MASFIGTSLILTLVARAPVCAGWIRHHYMSAPRARQQPPPYEDFSPSFFDFLIEKNLKVLYNKGGAPSGARGGWQNCQAKGL
jgi:hypothetical protein